MTNEIKKLKEDIAILQQKLEAIEKKEPKKSMDEVIERLVKEHQAQKLWNILKDYGFADYTAENICRIVEDWLPKPQNASGSQNLNTELLVEGFNHCLEKIKEMLR